MSNSVNSGNNSKDIVYLGSSSSEIVSLDLSHDNASINNVSESVNQNDGIISLGSNNVSINNETEYSVNQSDGIICLGSNHDISSNDNEATSVDQSELCPPLQIVYESLSSEDVEKEEITSPTQHPVRGQTRNEGRKGYQSLRANAEPPRSFRALTPTPPQPRTRTTALMIRADNHPDVIAERRAKARSARQANKKAGGHSK